MVFMNIPTNAITVRIPDAYTGILTCKAPWRSLTETVVVASTLFTITPGLRFGASQISGPSCTLDTVASSTSDGWLVTSTNGAQTWAATDYGLRGTAVGNIDLGIVRGNSTETYRGSPRSFCTVSARPAAAASSPVANGGGVAAALVQPVDPLTILSTGYCRIPFASLRIYGASDVLSSGVVLVVSMYVADAPTELTTISTLGFVNGWISRTITISQVGVLTSAR